MEKSSDKDSDCEIECGNASVITISDTSYDMLEFDKNPKMSCQNDDDIILFKFHIPRQDIFDKYGIFIADILKDKLTQIEEDPIEYFVKIANSKDDDFIITFKKIQQHYSEQQDNIECNLPVLEDNNDIQRKIIERRQRVLIKEQSPDFTGISELFTIDVKPDDKLNSINVPSYKRTIKDTMLDKEAATEKKLKEEQINLCSRRKPTNTCFNCGDNNHSLRECPLPRQQQRIKKAIKAMNKTERYHIDAEQRFSHLKPGKISRKLEEAMDLRRGELPFFFYRMRILGYPPAWLEDAKVEKSGITLFNSDGTEVLASDEDEGEIEGCTHKYNASKIIDFPGFNQHPGKHFYDDYKFHNVPPFSNYQLKSQFIKTLGDNVLNGYKRKKLKDLPSGNTTEESLSNITTLVVEDMEIEDSDNDMNVQADVQFTRPPLPSEEPPENVSQPPLPPSPCPSTSATFSLPTTPTTIISSETRDYNTSPTLLELEARQQKILQALQSNDSTIHTENDDSLIDEVLSMEEIPSITICSESSQESIKSCININTTADIIKESFMGAPLLKFSPYDRLPTDEKFKTGVSDVINFENLPDSTGKYEQMKQVLNKVRNAIQKLHDDDCN